MKNEKKNPNKQIVNLWKFEPFNLLLAKTLFQYSISSYFYIQTTSDLVMF